MNQKIVFVMLLGFATVSRLVAGDSDELKHKSKIHAKIVMEATGNAPADAKGTANLEGEAKNDRTKSKLKIHTDGLVEGDYTLSIIKRSDSSEVILGTVKVKEDGHAEHGGKVTLPSDLIVSDIAQITLTDSAGSAVLVGDLSSPANRSKVDFKVETEIEPGPAAPDAKGKASIRSTVYRGKVKERFSLHAEHVPADATFEILADGLNVGQVVSKSDGHVHLKALSGVNPSTLQSVQLVDMTGNVVLTADF
jgi:hypothetical protein